MIVEDFKDTDSIDVMWSEKSSKILKCVFGRKDIFLAGYELKTKSLIYHFAPLGSQHSGALQHFCGHWRYYTEPEHSIT